MYTISWKPAQEIVGGSFYVRRYAACIVNIFSLSLAYLMATSTVVPAFAANVTGSSDVTLTVEAEEQPEVI